MEAFGPMIGAPISETFGRKAIYLLSIPISILFTMATGLSQNIETVLICRFLSGSFGAPAVAVGAGTIADIWDRMEVASPPYALLLCLSWLGTGSSCRRIYYTNAERLAMAHVGPPANGRI